MRNTDLYKFALSIDILYDIAGQENHMLNYRCTCLSSHLKFYWYFLNLNTDDKEQLKFKCASIILQSISLKTFHLIIATFYIAV